MNLVKLPEDDAPSRDEVYQALVRSLRRRKGFGIVFVQCSPAEAAKIIRDLREDLPQKQAASLSFDKPIDNLYEIVDELPNREKLNILFIQGLEKSLEPYIKPGYGGDGDYYNLDTVPTILSHLNQRRELFRDHFHNICFVFFLPLFAIKYIIRRSPDLFDWSAGVFEFSEGEGFQKNRGDHYQELVTKQDIDDTWFNEVDELVELGRYEESISFFNQALEIEPDSHDILLRRGIVFCDHLRLYGKALDDFDSCIEIKSDSYPAWYNRGVALGNLGEYEEAISAFNKALEIKPDDYSAWHILGLVLGKDLSRYKEAIDAFNKALEIKSDDYSAWQNRGVALMNLGRHKDAIISYDRAIKINPFHYQAWSNRGNALRNLGRNEEAISAFNKALEIKPDDYNTLLNQGLSLSNLGKYEEAITSYDRAIAIKPDDYNTLLNQGAIFCDQLRLYEKALDNFERCIKINPNLYEAWENKGITLGKLSRHEEEISSFDKALEIKSDNHKAWNNRGITLINLGRYEEAIASYDKALEIKPDDHFALVNKGDALMNLGRYEEAISVYQQRLVIVKEIGNLQSEINTLNNLARAHFKLGQYRKGYGFIQQSTNLLTENDDLTLETYLSYLGIDVNKLGWKYFQQSVNLFKKFWKLIGRVVFSLEE